MAIYTYVANDVDGKKLKGEREAASEEALRYELLALNLAVASIKEKKPLLQMELAPKKIKPQEIMHFSRQVGAFAPSVHARRR